jgi:hypothetical protein
MALFTANELERRLRRIGRRALSRPASVPPYAARRQAHQNPGTGLGAQPLLLSKRDPAERRGTDPASATMTAMRPMTAVSGSAHDAILQSRKTREIRLSGWRAPFLSAAATGSSSSGVAARSRRWHGSSRSTASTRSIPLPSSDAPTTRRRRRISGHDRAPVMASRSSSPTCGASSWRPNAPRATCAWAASTTSTRATGRRSADANGLHPLGE